MLRLTGAATAAWRALCSQADVMPKAKFFYAVRKGFRPGVYSSWEECKSQVDKFPAAVFMKFGLERDAWAFVRGVEPSAPSGLKKGAQPAEAEPDAGLLPRRGPEPLEYFPLGRKRRQADEEVDTRPKRLKGSEPRGSESPPGFTYMGDAVAVYTDGCCSGNGKRGARAGIGVYWGRDHPLNVAERLAGRQTNQRAEIQAACRALQQAKEKNIKKLVLYSDSKFTINGVTRWVKNWKLNGWRLKSGGPVTNKEDFVKLDGLNSELDVVWMHVPGHAGYHGNEEADRLSKEGAAKPSEAGREDE
ncbi:ribonuclease H1 [Brachionichthys hirsutus]|uniref:ribonuclease H1 n=1 Tax=Brachionichthys hirsutus TaxID=412623 RepID=UPI0036053BAF